MHRNFGLTPLFSSYAVVGTRLFQTRFGQWCADGQYRFYGKFL